MAEVAVDFIKGNKYLSWYSDDAATMRHMRKLVEEYPDDVKIVDEDEDCLMIHLPVSWFREPKPKTTRIMTDEQREMAKERLAKARASKVT